MKYSIGVDMGGTNTDMGMVSENGNIIQRRNIPTNAYTELEPYVRDMMREIQAMVEEQRVRDGEAVNLEGIGIGAPGPLNFATGCILNPPNLPGWENFEIVSYFYHATGHKTYLNNDANVAGLAEALRGAGWGYTSVFYFTVSTGVGGAYVYRGEIVSLLKSTSIVGYIAVQDLTKMSDIIRARTYEAFFPLIATALIYFLLAWIITLILGRVLKGVDPKHRRAAKGGTAK